MDLLIFDFSLGHSRDMEDDPFVRSTRQKRHDYNSETAKKNSNIYIRTTLNENGDVPKNVSEDRIPPGNILWISSNILRYLLIYYGYLN